MTKTSLKQKTLLIVLGVALTLVLLEVVLRIGGALFLFTQERANRTGWDSEDIYRVLCIGESTTGFGDRFSYPAQMEEILNERGQGKRFKVFNKGIPAINTSHILADLDENLDKYRPHIVITMIGINDETYYYEPNKTFVEKHFPFVAKMRVFKLFKLIGQHLTVKFSGSGGKKLYEGTGTVEAVDGDLGYKDETIIDGFALRDALRVVGKIDRRLEKYGERMKRVPAQHKPVFQKVLKKLTVGKSHLLALIGRWYLAQEDFENAEKYFKEAFFLMPTDVNALVDLGICYRQQGRLADAALAFNQAISIQPKQLAAYIEAGRTHERMGEPEVTTAIYQNLLLIPHSEYWVFVEIGDWFVEQKLFPDAEKAYLKAIAAEPRNFFVYKRLSDVYLAMNKKEKAREYLEKERSVEKSKYRVETFENYNQIANKVLRRGIVLIAMQYPRRDVEPLKRQLKRADEIIFVENQKNFAKALKTASYSEIFYDSVAGDFGHCTVRGNRIIAENAAETILREVFKQEKAPQP